MKSTSPLNWTSEILPCKTFTFLPPALIIKIIWARSQKAGKHMTEKEMIKVSAEEFTRVQRYMPAADKESEIYKMIKGRDIELKVILTSSGVNISELDVIKE